MRKVVSDKGYTFLELLVVISIIGVLLLLSLASYSKAQAKSRDARRHADLAIVKVALESYFNDHGVYPAEKDHGVLGETELVFGNALIDNVGTHYMKKVPNDPLFNPSTLAPQYCYIREANKLSYTLGADFETEMRQCNPGTPTPVPATPPPVSPTPTPTQAVVTPGPTNPPTNPPGPTSTPFGTMTPYCLDCRKLVDSNPDSGYCCFSEDPNGLYTNNSCQDPAAGTGELINMTGCSITCSGRFLQRWRQIAQLGACITDPSFFGPGTEVGANCPDSCGSVIDYCTHLDLTGACTQDVPGGTPRPWYQYTSCLCY